MQGRAAFAVLMIVAGWSAAHGAVPKSLLLNEANTVSGDTWLDVGEDNRNRSDLTLGRLQGNGQNWMEFLVVQGDELGGGQFANTLDLRGWKVAWSYDKADATDPNKYGSGTIKFSNDPLWAAVPKGSLITFNEWRQAWYQDLNEDPTGHHGLSRVGGYNGLGELRGDPYIPGTHSLRDFSTDTRWNPGANGGGANGDWTINVWAGERRPDNSFKYFEFEGAVVDGDPQNPIAIGTTEGGLYALNNDNWQWTIADGAAATAENPWGNVIQGPIGEALSDDAWSVGSHEIFRLEAFPTTLNGPTLSSYLNAGLFDYADGTSSAFGKTNVWSGGSISQNLTPLRNWLVAGDVDLNGRVDGNDFLAWQRNLGKVNASLSDGDLNGDGTVSAADLALLKPRLGAISPVAVAVPEASGIVLAAMAFVSTLGRLKGRRS